MAPGTLKTRVPVTTGMCSRPMIRSEGIMGTDRNLLFAILALQAGHITSGRFAEACALWARRKAVPLADLLVEYGWLTSSDRSDLNRLMDSKLQERAGSARARAAAGVNDEVRRVLAVLADPDIENSLSELCHDEAVLSSTEIGVSIQHDRYKLDRLHATGGTGRVWLARDRDLGREVALKELRTSAAQSAKVYGRFLREAQITGQLEHPGIVPVYELTRHADGKQPFYTMRFVRGRTLTEAIRAYHREKALGQARQLEQLTLLNAFVGVCNTIAYAHSRGVIHRDLKGQNVVLGDFGEVMVLDWGLAKLLDRPGEDCVTQPLAVAGTLEAEATQEGQVMGTPAYMAPEQAGGQLELVDRRTDVYGLGAILYELLTGRPPFIGVDTQDVLSQVRDKEPSLPSQICEDVPPALEAICLTALAKNPQERFHSATELALEVQRWLADEPVAAYPEPWRATMRRWLGRHRALVAVLGASFLVAALCLAGSTSLLTVANQRERQATTLLLQREEEARAERDRAQVSFQLALNAVTVLSKQVSEDPRLSEKDLESLRKDLLQNGLRFYEELARLQSANPALQADRGRTLLLLGRIAEEIASVDEARKAYEEACGLFEQLTHDSPADAEHHYNLARSYAGLANGSLKTGQFREAETAFRRASIRGEQAVRQCPQNVEYPDSLASIYLQHGDLHRETFSRNVRYVDQPTDLVEQAEAFYQKALAIEEALAQEFPDTPRYQLQVGRIYHRLGSLRQHVGRMDEARAFHVLARELFELLVCEFPREASYRFQLA